MYYRTRTYIAADWDGDKKAIDVLYSWNDNKYLTLSFTNAHDLMQARDTSLNCSIKRSLKERMDASKTFVLIVGDNTASVRSGSCQYCSSYTKYSWGSYCARNYSVDLRSYIEYECDKAIEAGIKIVVLYNAGRVDKNKCPQALRNYGNHVPMWYWNDGSYHWDYQAIKNAIQ